MVETKIQMRFADVDMLRHVNNVNQQHYFDVGKNDYFAVTLGIQPGFRKEGMITAGTNTSYVSQIRYDTNVVVRTKLEKMGNKSFTLYQEILDGDTGELKTESRSFMVAYDFERQQSIPIPEVWRQRIAVHEGW